MQGLPQEKEELEIIETDVQEEVVEEQQDNAEAPEAENEDELEQYSDSVQKRISKLTHRYREEERQLGGRTTQQEVTMALMLAKRAVTLKSILSEKMYMLPMFLLQTYITLKKTQRDSNLKLMA